MHILRDVLEQAQTDGVAVGHFNISDLIQLRAVVEAAREVNVPVLVGASEGERGFMGVRQIAALVKSFREEFDLPIYLNADHTHSLASGEEVARAGFDSIVFDLSALPLEENVARPERQSLRSNQFTLRCWLRGRSAISALAPKYAKRCPTFQRR